MGYRESIIKYPDFLGNDNLAVKFQDRSDGNLEKICTEFCPADHFTGNSSLEKVLSLMDFIHNLLFCPGGAVSPERPNTFSIMKIRSAGAVFCSSYSTVMSEMLLSLGVKAVRISCLPLNFDSDCHVGVMVYLEDVNKWAFLDPTFNTFFYDEEGVPLDIFEIRNAYGNGCEVNFRNITINKQWKLFLNGVEYFTYDSWYYDYMMKNSFRFILPCESRFDYSYSDDAMYYIINPMGYDSQNEYDGFAGQGKIIYTNMNVFQKTK